MDLKRRKEIEDFAKTPETTIIYALSLLSDIIDFNLVGKERDTNILDAKEIILDYIKNKLFNRSEK